MGTGTVALLFRSLFLGFGVFVGLGVFVGFGVFKARILSLLERVGTGVGVIICAL